MNARVEYGDPKDQYESEEKKEDMMAFEKLDENEERLGGRREDLMRMRKDLVGEGKTWANKGRLGGRREL